MRYRHSTNWQKVIKDYAVPLVGLLLILFLIISYAFSGSSTDTSNSNENKIGMNVTLDDASTEAYVTYPDDDYKKKIEGNVTIYKGEKINVTSGGVSLTGSGTGIFHLDKGGELKLQEDGTIALYSSDLWVNNTTPLAIQLPYAKVNIGENGILNISQNEVGSTVYNISGFVEVGNIAGKNTVLPKGQKITILSKDATKTDVDVSLLKEDIDDFFKASDWFLKNGGDAAMAQEEKKTSTGATQTGATQTSTGAKIELTNFQDEQTFKESTITIVGKTNDSNVAFVSIGNTKVPVRETDNVFELRGVQLTQKINDLVLKTYDGSGNVISKYAYTAYLDGAVAQTTDKKDLFEVKNYPLDSSKFKFISPKENPFTTTERIFTLEGTVPENTVEKIDVNGFVLTKFPKNGTYWKYHINADYGNLKEGLNIYEVKYMGKDGTVIFKNAFTVIKKGEQKTVSDEATSTGTVKQ